MRSRGVAVAAGLLIGTAAMAFALHGVPLAAVGHALQSADLGVLVAVAALFLVQQGIRAVRQQVLLGPGHPRLDLHASASVLCISFFIINSMPARLGELARPLLLAERAGVPLGAGLGLLVLERTIDLAAMFIMLAALPLVVPDGVLTVEIGSWALDLGEAARTGAWAAIPTALLGVAGAPFLAPRAWAVIHPRLPRAGRAGRLCAPLARLGADFAAAVGGLAAPRRLAAVLALTAATWTVTAAMYPLLAHAFGLGDRIDLAAGFALLGVVMASLAVPAAPGFAGTYEAFLAAGLGLFGVGGPDPVGAAGSTGDAVALAYALTMHWWVHVVQAATAVGFLCVDRISVRRLLHTLGEALRGEARG